MGGGHGEEYGGRRLRLSLRLTGSGLGDGNDYTHDYCPNKVLANPPPDVWGWLAISAEPRKDAVCFFAPGREPCGARTGGGASGWTGAATCGVCGFKKLTFDLHTCLLAVQL